MSAAKKLAPQHMIDGYLALTAKAKEQLGPQAWVECEQNLYWVHVFPEVPRVCLGLAFEQASATLDAVVVGWHRHWRAMAEQFDYDERRMTDYEWDYYAWYMAWRDSEDAQQKTQVDR